MTFEELKRFCSTDEWRPELHEPFLANLGPHDVEDGDKERFAVATDGALLIADRSIATLTRIVMPDGLVSLIYSSLHRVERWFPWPLASGAVQVNCRCNACHGKNDSCRDCGGEGIERAVMTQAGWVRRAYVEALASLDGIECGVPCGSVPLHFRYATGVGAVMPLHSWVKVLGAGETVAAGDA